MKKLRLYIYRKKVSITNITHMKYMFIFIILETIFGHPTYKEIMEDIDKNWDKTCG